MGMCKGMTSSPLVTVHTGKVVPVKSSAQSFVVLSRCREPYAGRDPAGGRFWAAPILAHGQLGMMETQYFSAGELQNATPWGGQRDSAGGRS